MRQEGSETPRTNAAPKAFAFDGWSMVPFAPPQADLPLAETPPEALPEPVPL